MKSKILFIVVVVLAIVACGTTYLAFNAYYGYESNKADDVTIDSIPKEIKHQNELSPEMENSLYTITNNANEYAIFAKNLFQNKNRSSWNKSDVINQLNEFKYNIESVSSYGTTELDKEFEAVLYYYQYNAVKCIEYAISYVNTGNKDELIMHNSYAQDLKTNMQELKFLAQKHNVN